MPATAAWAALGAQTRRFHGGDRFALGDGDDIRLGRVSFDIEDPVHPDLFHQAIKIRAALMHTLSFSRSELS